MRSPLLRHVTVILLAIVLANVAILLAPAVLAAPDGKRVATEQEFRELVVDRQLTGGQTILWYIGDGRMAGVSRDQRIEGTWEWVGATLCRTATVGPKDLSYDCQAVFIVGDLVVIVRDEGSGRAFALRIGGGDSEEFACFC